MSRALAFQFLCGCLTRDLEQARRDQLRQLAQSGAFAWDTFVELASTALVAPALLDTAHNNGLEDMLPADVVDFLQGMAILNRQRNKQIRTECIALAAMLNERDVVAVLLKGSAHLLSELHGDPAHRIMVDIDVLVPEPRLSDCAAAMHEHGYRVLWDNGYPASHHYPPLGRAGSHASVELHVRPLMDPFGGLLTSAEILATRSELHVDNATLALPSVQARVIHAIVHAQLASYACAFGQFLLRDLLDYARLCEMHADDIDWADISGRFTAHRAATALGYQVLAAKALLGVPIAPEIRTGPMARILYRIAIWQLNHPRLQDLRIRLLRPLLLFKRTMSSSPLRRKLLRDLRDVSWLRRQWLMLLHQDTHKP